MKYDAHIQLAEYSDHIHVSEYDEDEGTIWLGAYTRRANTCLVLTKDNARELIKHLQTLIGDQA